MSGFEPILIGSALGAMTNSKNPLQGALLGGVLGGVGGAAMGGFKAAGSAGTAGLAGGGKSGMFTAGTQVANPMGASGTYFASGNPAASLGNAAMEMGQTAIGTSPSLGSQLSGSLQGVTQFAKENPFAMSSGLNAAQQLYGEKPMEFPQAPGLLRGNPIPEQPPSYAAMSPMQPITLI